MATLRRKTISILGVLLIVSMIASTLLISNTSAHSPSWNIDTYSFLAIFPNPVGVGQEAYVTFGIDKVPMTVSTRYGDRWTNFTLVMTKPDGTKQSMTGFTADDTGFANTKITPTEVGNYSFKLYFGGQTLLGSNPPPTGFSANAKAFIGDYYKPSESVEVKLTVTEEPATSLPFNPLPTDYWQRPINMMNSNWNTISGNWLGGEAFTNGGLGYNCSTNFNPYTKAPNSPHIVWTKQVGFGGLIGGEYGDTAGSNFYSTGQYEAYFKAVIINGILYYTSLPVSSTNPQGTIAVDVRTGEELWTKPMNGTLRCGQIFNYVSPNQYGGLSYLWTTTWSMYDAMTGSWILDITGGPSVPSQLVMGEDGSVLAYYINSTTGTFNLWNSSRAILRGATGTGDANGWSWRPAQNAKIPWEYGIEWSKPLPTNISGVAIDPALSICRISSDVALLISQPTFGGYWMNYQIQAGFSLNTGQMLWIVNRTVEPPWSYISGSFNTITARDGKYFVFNGNTQTFSCYSLTTGEKIWGPSVSLRAEGDSGMWSYLSTCVPADVAYGTLYWSDFGGNLWALDENTGELKWHWFAGAAGYDTVYGSWPVKVVEAIADGKVFLLAGHVYNPPLFRGSHLYCINATTGETIWKSLGFTHANGPLTYIADGYLLVPNAYDKQIYCYGKGQTATTVAASPEVSEFGSSVLIKGTVTDQSPGETCLGIPAKGTAAIADECQEAWMDYLYQQQPKPTNATGVEVTLDVIDANGNFRNIGSTISDATGAYSYMWTPDIPGKYTLIASFAGSESYWSSSSETAFGVTDSAPTPPPPQAITTGLATTTDLMMYVGAAIAINIILIAVIAILLLRKRP
jgi:outer membrane protein assembly factor BamB